MNLWQTLVIIAALSVTGGAIACAINSRVALGYARRERAAALDALHNRLNRLEQRLASRTFLAGRRDEAVDLAPPSGHFNRRRG